jgi:hypothetical protein
MIDFLKMHKTNVWIATLVVAYFVSIVLNASSMLFGHDDPVVVVTTIAYIIVWALCLVFNRHSKKILKISVVCAAIALASAFMGFVVTVTGLSFGGLEFFIIPFVTSFTGIAVVFDYKIAYCIIVLLTAVWLGAGIWLRKRPVSITEI